MFTKSHWLKNYSFALILWSSIPLGAIQAQKFDISVPKENGGFSQRLVLNTDWNLSLIRKTLFEIRSATLLVAFKKEWDNYLNTGEIQEKQLVVEAVDHAVSEQLIWIEKQEQNSKSFPFAEEIDIDPFPAGGYGFGSGSYSFYTSKKKSFDLEQNNFRGIVSTKPLCDKNAGPHALEIRKWEKSQVHTKGTSSSNIMEKDGSAGQGVLHLRIAYIKEMIELESELLKKYNLEPSDDLLEHPEIISNEFAKHLDSYHGNPHKSLLGFLYDLRIIKNVSAIAQKENLTTVISCDSFDQLKYIQERLSPFKPIVTYTPWKVKGPAVILVPLNHNSSVWLEDDGEFLRNNSIGIPNPCKDNVKKEFKSMSDYLEQSRQKDGYFACRGVFGENTGNYLKDLGVGVSLKSNPISVKLGAVFLQGELEKSKIQLANCLNYKVIPFESYIEGGNAISGTKDGKPYLMVGIDSLRASEYINNKTYATDEFKELVAKDYGVDKSSIALIPQPATFHLDMGLTPVNNGVVIVNDSMKALDLIISWLSPVEDRIREKVNAFNQDHEDDQFDSDDLEWEYPEGKRFLEFFNKKQMRTLLEPAMLEAKKYEDMTAKELEQAGLTVVREALRFPATPFSPEMNFFNGERTESSEGEQLLLTNGGSFEGEKHAAEVYKKWDLTLNRIWFINPEASFVSLYFQGGLGCRIKQSKKF